MGSSVPWSGGHRKRVAYRNLLAAAAAVACVPRTELRPQHAGGAYFFSAAAWFEPAEGRPALLDGTRLRRRGFKLRPDIGLRPPRAIRRSHSQNGLLDEA